MPPLVRVLKKPRESFPIFFTNARLTHTTVSKAARWDRTVEKYIKTVLPITVIKTTVARNQMKDVSRGGFSKATVIRYTTTYGINPKNVPITAKRIEPANTPLRCAANESNWKNGEIRLILKEIMDKTENLVENTKKDQGYA